MEILDPQPEPQNEPRQERRYYLPSHSNYMIWSILCTIFCCQIGGIIAIVYSVQSNNLYNCALAASDEYLRNKMFNESEQKNRTARIWLFISGGWVILFAIIWIILMALGVFAGLLENL